MKILTELVVQILRNQQVMMRALKHAHRSDGVGNHVCTDLDLEHARTERLLVQKGILDRQDA